MYLHRGQLALIFIIIGWECPALYSHDISFLLEKDAFTASKKMFVCCWIPPHILSRCQWALSLLDMELSQKLLSPEL